MRELLRSLLYTPLVWLAGILSSRPDHQRVFRSLTRLLHRIRHGNYPNGLVIPFEIETARFIIFSDQHKGRRTGADMFAATEANYNAALHHYNNLQFHFINLGDGEELWGNSISEVREQHVVSFASERLFAGRNAFTKVFGNHDLFWDNDPRAARALKNIFKNPVRTYEGLILQTSVKGRPFNIFCTHGHQGDRQSDGNLFSKFFVGQIWGPLQEYLGINPNTPSCVDKLKTLHNQMMYEWSGHQNDLLLITGHTHQPVFESLTHLERLHEKLEAAKRNQDSDRARILETEIRLRNHSRGSTLPARPTYFNTGCCCFNDGDITGIEISDGKIRLVKWEEQRGKSVRCVLEEADLARLCHQIIETNPVH